MRCATSITSGLDGPFAAADAFSIADCALIPFFHNFEGLQTRTRGRFKTCDLVCRHPRLEAWWQRTKASEIGAFASRTIDEAIEAFLRGLGRQR
jgi:glutathione S-transferase